MTDSNDLNKQNANVGANVGVDANANDGVDSVATSVVPIASARGLTDQKRQAVEALIERDLSELPDHIDVNALVQEWAALRAYYRKEIFAAGVVSEVKEFCYEYQEEKRQMVERFLAQITKEVKKTL